MVRWVCGGVYSDEYFPAVCIWNWMYQPNNLLCTENNGPETEIIWHLFKFNKLDNVKIERKFMTICFVQVKDNNLVL